MYGDYFYLASNIGDAADYRIQNACEEMIGIVDSVAKQNELREHYRKYTIHAIESYCLAVGTNPETISEEEVQYIGRDVANRIIGEVTCWIGDMFPLHRRQIIGVCRGPPGYDGEAQIEMKRNEVEWNIAEEYANRITGKVELDVSDLCVGFRGSGKSRRSNTLGERTAAWISWIRDQDPTVKGSRNYFNEDMIAVISADAANELMANRESYVVKQFDDITAKGWNSRNFAKKENKEQNAEFMINRVNRQVQLFTFPDLFTLDKVPREMASHITEMSKSTVKMREKVEHSLGKTLEISKQFRKNLPLYRLPIFKGYQVSYIAYPRCTPELEKWYGEIRTKYEEQALKQDDEREMEVKLKKSAYQINAEKKVKEYESVKLKSPNMKHTELLREVGISKRNWSYWEEKGWIPRGVRE